MNKKIKAVIMGIIITNFLSTGVLATELDDAQDQSNQIQQNIKDGQSKLDDIKKNKDDVASQIAYIDQEVGQAQLEVDQLNLQIQNAEIEKNELDQKLDKVEEDLEALKNVINQRFRKLYKDNGDTYIDLLFNSKDFSDLIDRMEIIKTITTKDKKNIEEFKDKQKELSTSIKKIYELKETLNASKKKYDNRLEDLRKYKNEKDALLNKLNYDQAAQEAMLAQQEAELQQVLDKIKNSQNNGGNGGNSGMPVVNGNYHRITGTVKYPITSPYEGNRTNPVSGRQEPHYAIDIGAPGGSYVYALKDGVVEYAGWMTGYGNVVIINHGDMNTLYAHNQSLLVSVGQSVKGGQQISVVGSTGNSTGPHIHFEVIINGEKKDPTPYYI